MYPNHPPFSFFFLNRRRDGANRFVAPQYPLLDPLLMIDIQFCQEGYNVIHLIYPSELPEKAFEVAQTEILAFGADWGLITYGLLPKDASTLVSHAALSMADLKACVHFCPLSESSKGYLIHNEEKQYIP